MSDMETLARRAVACAGWRWMPGMRALALPELSAYDGYRITWACESEGMGGAQDDVGDPKTWGLEDGHAPMGSGPYDPGWLPDLTDPATLGCLLALVREAWGDPMPMVDTLGAGPYWSVWSGHVCRARGCATEAEALVVALEAAPQKGIGSSPAPGPPP